jgi:hypothetical protein
MTYDKQLELERDKSHPGGAAVGLVPRLRSDNTLIIMPDSQPRGISMLIILAA